MSSALRMETEFYRRLDSRCPINQLLEFFSVNDVSLHAQIFVDRFEMIEKCNNYYAKCLCKMFVDDLDLVETEEEAEAAAVSRGTWRRYVRIYNTRLVCVSEWLYEKYVLLLQIKQPDPHIKDVVKYTLLPNVSLRLEEMPYVISYQGTTGLRTWEAGLLLAMYLGQYPRGSISGRVVELGAGTGTVSIAISKLFMDTIERLDVTDGNYTIVNTQLPHNFALNNMDQSKIRFQKLEWNLDEDNVGLTDTDLVVAADVTYDSSVVPDLCASINKLLNNGKETSQCILSATERNLETLQLFEDTCHEQGLECLQVYNTEHDTLGLTPILTQDVLFKPLLAPIRIYEIHKSTQDTACFV